MILRLDFKKFMFLVIYTDILHDEIINDIRDCSERSGPWWWYTWDKNYPLVAKWKLSNECSLYQPFSKCGCWTRSFNTTCELVRMQVLWLHPRSTKSERLGWSSAIYVNNPSSVQFSCSVVSDSATLWTLSNSIIIHIKVWEPLLYITLPNILYLKF